MKNLLLYLSKVIGVVSLGVANAECLTSKNMSKGIWIETDDGLRTHIRLTRDKAVESLSYELDGGWGNSWSRAPFGVYDLATGIPDFEYQAPSDSEYEEFIYEDSIKRLPEPKPGFSWRGSVNPKEDQSSGDEMAVEAGQLETIKIGNCEYNTFDITKTRFNFTVNEKLEPTWVYKYIYIMELKAGLFIGSNYMGGDIGPVQISAMGRLEHDFWEPYQ